MYRRQPVRTMCLIAMAIAVCMIASGCDPRDYMTVQLPCQPVWRTSSVRGSDWDTGADDPGWGGNPYCLGQGAELYVAVDLRPLPRDVAPDSVVSAVLDIPCRSTSAIPGSVSFQVYMLEGSHPVPVDTDQWFPQFGELPPGAKPLSTASLSHDAGYRTEYMGTYPPIQVRIQYRDTSTKHLSLRVSEAVKAWLSGTPNLGLLVKQKTLSTVGPTWSLADRPDGSGIEPPKVTVLIKKTEVPQV